MNFAHRFVLKAALASSLFAGQEPNRPPSPVIRITSDLVVFDVAVMDSRNRPVVGLEAADFSVLEDGKPQTITSFSYSDAASGPRSIVFLLDACENRPLLAQIPPFGQTGGRSASFLSDFIDRWLQPWDSVAIMGAVEGSGYIYGPYGEKEHLHNARRAVRLPWRADFACLDVAGNAALALELGDFERPPEQADQPRYQGIASYDGIAEALDGLAVSPGRRSLVVFSTFTGWATFRAGSREIDELVRRAKTAGVAVYVVDHDIGFDRPPMASFSAGSAVLTPPGELLPVKAHKARLAGPARLAAETGGFVIDVPLYFDPGGIIRSALPPEKVGERATSGQGETSRREEPFFAASVERIATDISGAYQIGFKPRADFEGVPKFHKVKFTVNRKGMTVHARDGYYAPPFAQPPEPQSPDETLGAALENPFRGKDIAVKLLPLQSAVTDSKTKRRRATLRAVVSIDPSDLTYEGAPDGTKRAEVDVRVAAFGNRNIQAATASRKCASTLKPAEYAARASLRLFCNLDVPIAEPGGYMLRAAVLDRKSEKVGSAFAFAPVPNYDFKKKVPGSSYATKPGYNPARRIMVSGMLLGLAETGANADDGMHPAGANPVDREFPPGAMLAYSFEAYGGEIDRKTGLPVLTGTAQVYSPSSALPVLDSGPMPIRVDDPGKMTVMGKIALDPNLKAGQYDIEVIVADEKHLFPSPVGGRRPANTQLDASENDFTLQPAPR